MFTLFSAFLYYHGTFFISTANFKYFPGNFKAPDFVRSSHI
jgi:hypothetical protein